MNYLFKICSRDVGGQVVMVFDLWPQA